MCNNIKGNQSIFTMEQLNKAGYEINKPMIVPNEAVDLKKESKMVIECRSGHTLLQDEFLSCILKKNIHVGSFLVMFLMLLSLLMFYTWMVVVSFFQPLQFNFDSVFTIANVKTPISLIILSSYF
jgi:hypothetical protein